MEEHLITSDTTWHRKKIMSDTPAISSDTEKNNEPTHNATGLVAKPVASWEGLSPYI